jgi:hypothetical protein
MYDAIEYITNRPDRVKNIAYFRWLLTSTYRKCLVR